MKMKKIKSIGLIETLGMVGAIEAADTALKAANVTFLGYELNKAGFVTIKFTGDVAAVKAAVGAGAATARKVGNLVATHVIPRPAGQLAERLVYSGDNVPRIHRPDDTAETAGPAPGSEKAVSPASGPKETELAPVEDAPRAEGTGTFSVEGAPQVEEVGKPPVEGVALLEAIVKKPVKDAPVPVKGGKKKPGVKTGTAVKKTGKPASQKKKSKG